MNTRFKVCASYNILQYLCDFIHVLIFVTVSKCRKSPKLTNIMITYVAHSLSLPRFWLSSMARISCLFSSKYCKRKHQCFTSEGYYARKHWFNWLNIASGATHRQLGKYAIYETGYDHFINCIALGTGMSVCISGVIGELFSLIIVLRRWQTL
jgi:hypothetical protein